MRNLDRQVDYWNRVASKKEFAHPFDSKHFQSLVPSDGRILDYGCGYGRIGDQLLGSGYKEIFGIDVSEKMIEQASRRYPQIEFTLLNDNILRYEDEYFDAVVLFAVLTCVPGDVAQQEIIRDIYRVLRFGGILYVSDLPLQEDERNQARYRDYARQYGVFGVFELPDGGVVRHHSMDWIETLLRPFEKISTKFLPALTMNQNPVKIFQYFGKKCGNRLSGDIT
ncbi:MAG: class I SAM-dependent methyltransferase [Sedimentisphaerales bacterium]|nr:class I SAM-dependent methyltransferase [Sedimentisphaerales bacterium]